MNLRECLCALLGSESTQILLARAAALTVEEQERNFIEEAEIERAFFRLFENHPESFLEALPELSAQERVRLLTSFELGRRYSDFTKSSGVRAIAKNPAQAAILKIKTSLRCASHEWLGFVPLYPNGEVGGFCFIEKGVRTHVNVDPAELFAKVLALRPRGFFLFHNHPGGSLEASAPDLNLTDRVAQMAHQLNTPLLGHYIITSEADRLI